MCHQYYLLTDTNYRFIITSCYAMQSKMVNHWICFQYCTQFDSTKASTYRLWWFIKSNRIIDIINSSDSPLCFTQNQSAVLLFLNVEIICTIDVKIKRYYDFALLDINPMNTTGNNVTVAISLAANKHFEKFNPSLGSGSYINAVH